MVNQTAEGLSYEIRCWSQTGILYTNALIDNAYDTKAIYDLYTKELGYLGVQVWHDGVNMTDSFKNAKTYILKKD